MAKKYVICIPSSDDFALSTAVLIYSLERNFSMFKECDIKVPYNNLTEKGMNLIRKACPDVIFEKPKDNSFYKDVAKTTIYGDGNYDVYLSFEVFAQSEYDKAIYLDSDMVCTKDFSEVLAANNTKSFMWRRGVDSRGKDCHNNGLMVVGKKYLEGTYEKLIHMVKHDPRVRNHSGGDQEAVKLMFDMEERLDADNVGRLSELYNCLDWGGGGRGNNKRFGEIINDVKLIHFSGRRKPWGGAWQGGDGQKNCMRYPFMMQHCSAVRIWNQHYEEFKILKLGEKLGPYEKFQIQHQVIVPDTPEV